MSESESIAKIAPALVKALGAMPVLAKDSDGQVGQQKVRYASLDAVLDVIRPAFAEHELALLMFPLRAPSGLVGIRARLLHSSGEWMETEFELPAQQTSQGHGSGFTYARRYAALAMAGLAPEDDDGRAAMPPRNRNANTQQERQQRPAVSGFDPDPETGEIRDQAQKQDSPTATQKDLQLFYIDATGAQPKGLGFTRDQVHTTARRESLKGISVAGLNRLYKVLKAQRDAENQPPPAEPARPATTYETDAPPDTECTFCHDPATRAFGDVPCCQEHAPSNLLLSAGARQ